MTDLLIVTSETDIHADVVIEELQKSNIRAIRLNSESFIQKSQYFYEWQASGHPIKSFLSFEDSLREVEEVGVIWWLKPEKYQVFPEVNDPFGFKYCQQETESLIDSIYGLYPKARWVNYYSTMRFLSNRINQIPTVHKLGITIPPTLVTNSYDAAGNFVREQGKCLVKPMRYSGFLHDKKQYACYTNPIDLETLEDFRYSIRLAPVFIQKRIQKKAEYCVTLIGIGSKFSLKCLWFAQWWNSSKI